MVRAVVCSVSTVPRCHLMVKRCESDSDTGSKRLFRVKLKKKDIPNDSGTVYAMYQHFTNIRGLNESSRLFT